MNDEEKTTEAEQTKLGDLTASIERMIADLGTIESIIRTTRLLAEGMENGVLKWATLCKALGDIRHVLPDACLHKVYDFAPVPLDPTAPKPVQGDGHVWKAIETDTCGIRRANGTVRAWAIRENAGVEVFAKQIFKDGKPEPCWTFAGTVDCEKVIFGGIIGGRNKANQIVRFIRNGLLASRLRLKHKRMNKKVREVDSGRPDLTVIDDPGTGKGEPSHE